MKIFCRGEPPACPYGGTFMGKNKDSLRAARRRISCLQYVEILHSVQDTEKLILTWRTSASFPLVSLSEAKDLVGLKFFGCFAYSE
jgi:hypothetical protein